MARVRLALAALIVTLSACGGVTFGPDLDSAVRDWPAAQIREKIVSHQDWGNRLSADQLDQLATFLETYAGQAGAPADDLGRVEWIAAGCGSCHALASGGD